jgi:hypothetical protein
MPFQGVSPSIQLTHLDGDGSLHAGINVLSSQDGQRCYVYVSRIALAHPTRARLLATIHGYSGSVPGAEGHSVVQDQCLTSWVQAAEQHGWVIVAPHFDAALFNDDFQRLNPWGTRADVRLNQWCEVLQSLLSGLKTATMGLFGFSGGGQFVHRYVAFHPQRVHRAVAAAAGWYMWPDRGLPYPLGIGPSATPDRLTLDMRAVCTVPLLILVGADDVAPGLETEYRGHDLIQLQGESRKARACTWVAVVQSLAAAQGWPCRVEFAIIPDTRHVLSNALRTAAEVFLATE